MYVKRTSSIYQQCKYETDISYYDISGFFLLKSIATEMSMYIHVSIFTFKLSNFRICLDNQERLNNYVVYVIRHKPAGDNRNHTTSGEQDQAAYLAV
jgi:hypothetical protein